MFRILSLAASLSISLSTAFAEVKEFTKINRAAVVQQVAVEPVNAGINPAYSAYRISGEVLVGSNSCGAQGLKASFRVVVAANGQQKVVPYIKGSQPSQLMCPMDFRPVYQNISVIVRGRGKLADKVRIHNVDEMGHVVVLRELLDQNNPSDCDELAMCTREYRPTSCSLNGVTISGNNNCEARANFKRHACLNRIEFVDSQLDCKFSGKPLVEIPDAE